MISHEEEKEMLAAHALGALDADEARRVEEHLATCAECRAEMQVWRETSSALAYLAEPAMPSAALRSRILESVRAEEEVEAEGGEKREVTAKPALMPKAAPSSSAHASSSNVIAMTSARGWRRAQTFGAIAAALAIMALSTALFVMWRRLDETRRELARNEAERSALARQVAEEKGARELLTSPQSQSAMLAGTNMAPQARAQIVFDRSTGRAMLFAYNLPPVPAGKAYQLWFISGGRVMPGKVFTPDTTGRAMINEQVPVTNLDAQPVFAVTLEPAGGVQVATGEKYLLSAAASS